MLRRRTVVGLLILAATLVLDGGDTLPTAMIFDSGRMGAVDCMIASWFLSLGCTVAYTGVLNGSVRQGLADRNYYGSEGQRRGDRPHELIRRV